MRRAIVRALVAKAATAGKHEVVGQVTSAAGEILRVRRDPAVVAQRRLRAAKRRTTLWSVGAAFPSAGLATTFLGKPAALALEGFALGRTILYAAVLLLCLYGVIRGVQDIRARNRVIRELPPPPPHRPTVSPKIRDQMNKLGGYSDGLRQLAAMTGVDRDTDVARELRRDIIVAADAAERTLRRRAAELSGIHEAIKGTPREAVAGLQQMAGQLTAEITAGVTAYGDLVSVASEIVVAANALRSNSIALQDPTDQLRGLAMGMRELAGS